ncbi:MAG TPA: DinB family protein [Gemmataceae bacterium]|nr:DinB family protein [Gemmataceae bacterium]
MSEAARILDQMHRGWDGDAWHGTPLWTMLRDVTASEANARPVAGGHTIAEIVQHLSYWRWATVERVNGEKVTPSHDEQWPPVRDASESTWREALALLESRHQELMQTVEKLSDEQLTQPIAGRDYHVYVQLHGTLQHDIYHAGQIVLLKRLART